MPRTDTRAAVTPVFAALGDLTRLELAHRLADGSPRSIAQLADGTFEITGSQVDCVTILTTAANDAVSPIHHRMPVILPAAARATWLAGDAPRDAVRAMLRPWAGELSIAEADLKRAA